MVVNEQLRALYPEWQLRQLDAVRSELLSNPKALDNHSREVRNGEQGSESGSADA